MEVGATNGPGLPGKVASTSRFFFVAGHPGKLGQRPQSLMVQTRPGPQSPPGHKNPRDPSARASMAAKPSTGAATGEAMIPEVERLTLESDK